MVTTFIWKYGLYVMIIWSLFESSCSSGKGNLPYHPPVFAPMYREECYSDRKNFLCMDKEKETGAMFMTFPLMMILQEIPQN